jgi:glycosyltransferase involved in cell wall biosynthesis
LVRLLAAENGSWQAFFPHRSGGELTSAAFRVQFPDMSARRVFGTLDPFFEGGDVMGRKVANAAFMRTLLRADPFDAYHFFPPGERMAQALAADLTREAPELMASGRVRIMPRLELPARLADTAYHCFHLSDCMLSQPHLARLRRLHAPRPMPVTGGIHSLSRADYMAAFLPHLWPGATGREAIVCTSRAGRAAVAAFFESLREAYGLDAVRFPGPRLETIGLGVDASAIAPPGPATRKAAREAAGIPTDAVAALVLGRLEHHSKMDLLPLLRAFQLAFAGRLARGSAHLILAGWGSEDDEILPVVRSLAANIGLGLTVRLRPSEADKAALLAAADYFLSPSDNVQETFGLTLLEAGAAGLPVLASDYDGYRDIVVHEETGLLVPTVGPAATTALDALARLLPDNQAHLLLAQQTAVDVALLAEGITRLCTDEALRCRLGVAARTRVEGRFTWEAVVAAHLEMWERLWAEPVKAADQLRLTPHPLHLPYARVFAAHPAQSGLSGLRLTRSRAGEAVYRGQEHPLFYAGVSHLVDAGRLRALLVLARAPLDGEELAQRLARALPGCDAEAASFIVLWALKHGYLERA